MVALDLVIAHAGEPTTGLRDVLVELLSREDQMQFLGLQAKARLARGLKACAPAVPASKRMPLLTPVVQHLVGSGEGLRLRNLLC